MTRLLRRLRYLLRRDRHERELDDELQFHLEMKQRELEANGLDRVTASATARRALGNLPLTRDHVRDVWIAPWLRSLAQDVRFAGRLLVKERGFTFAVVLVLGVGMALTGGMYTVLNAILFGGLPGDGEGRIVSLGTRDELGRPAGVSLLDFEDWRDGNETFDGIAVMLRPHSTSATTRSPRKWSSERTSRMMRSGSCEPDHSLVATSQLGTMPRAPPVRQSSRTASGRAATAATRT